MRINSKEILRILMIIVGNFIDATGFVLFVSGSGLITGGASGIGLFFSRQFDVPSSVVVFIINAIMLIIGFVALGKRFALSTIISTFMYPGAMAILEYFFGGIVVTEDIFLCTVMGGLLIGLGAGLLIRAGASSGGMDIPPLIANKYWKVPLSSAIYIVDIVVLALQAFQRPGDKVLYGLVMVFIYSAIIERLSVIGRHRVEVQIISDKKEEIRSFIIDELDRGVTLMNATSGYFHRDIEVLMTVISTRQLSRLEQMVHKADPKAFMVVNRVSQVVGEGFTYAPSSNVVEYSVKSEVD